VAQLAGFSPEAVDAMTLMAVVRYRLLADRLPHAHARGVRQLVILGAGLDTTAFALPAWAVAWRVFEVDHPATQAWKRHQIAQARWAIPPNLAYAPCNFERQDLRSALTAAGFDCHRPAIVSLFGVLLYLTGEATQALLTTLATFHPGSEVTLTYTSPPDGTDRVVQETLAQASRTRDPRGERFRGYNHAAAMERLVRAAGFRAVRHHPIETLNACYFSGRSDGLRLRALERLLTAVCGDPRMTA